MSLERQIRRARQRVTGEKIAGAKTTSKLIDRYVELAKTVHAYAPAEMPTWISDRTAELLRHGQADTPSRNELQRACSELERWHAELRGQERES
jgi:hypothetical protein